MPNNNNTPQNSQAIYQRMRLNQVKRLSDLLFDKSNPDGPKEVSEDQWEAILIGPCNGDKQLVAEVCEFERKLRATEDDEFVPVRFRVPADEYIRFISTFLGEKHFPVDLLWNSAESDWYPEDSWRQRLRGRSEDWQKNIKKLARKLKEVRNTCVYDDMLPKTIVDLL